MSTSLCASRSRRATAMRSGPTQTGQPLRRDRTIGSSPTSAASSAIVAARASASLAPYPRETIPGCQPFFFRNSAIQSTSGVLPAPPTVMLPTTITGMPGWLLFRIRSLKRSLLEKARKPNATLAGHSRKAAAALRCQGSTLLAGLRREGDLRQAGHPRRLHHPHHRLVGGVGVRADHDHRVLLVERGPAQHVGERVDAGELRRRAVDHVLPLGVDQDIDLARPLEL